MSATKHEIESRSVRPVIRPVRTENLPAALRDYAQWVHWRYERVGERWTKILFYIDYIGPNRRPWRYNGSSMDPRTWREFETIAGPTILAEHTGAVGMGFVLTTDDPILCIDLDDCRNRETGELTTFAADLVRRADSYTEVSPSGTGLKIFLLAKKPGDRCKNTSLKVEMYDRARFVALTGERLAGAPDDLQQRQEFADSLYAELFPVAATPIPAPVGHASRPAPRRLADLSDQAVIDRARNAKNGLKFDALFRGDISRHNGDQSAADAALAAHLAFWTQDASQIGRIMYASGLVREKWMARKGYLDATIAKAIAGCRAHYGDGRYDDAFAAELADIGDVSGLFAPAAPSPSAAPRSSDLADLARFTVAPGQMGHPDYWQEERQAAAAQREYRRDFTRFPCSCPRGISFRHKFTGVPYAGVFRCERWMCPGCHAYLVEYHLENCRVRFGAAERQEDTLHVFDSHDQTWARDRKRLARLGASYWCCRADDDSGALRVIATACVPTSSPLSSSAIALAIARGLLETYQGERRAVRTSRDWSAPKAEKSDQLAACGQIALPSADFFGEAAEAVGAAVALLGMMYGGHTLGMYRFDKPGGWEDEQREELLDYLRLGEILPKLDWYLAESRDNEPPVIYTLSDDLALC